LGVTPLLDGVTWAVPLPQNMLSASPFFLLFDHAVISDMI